MQTRVIALLQKSILPLKLVLLIAGSMWFLRLNAALSGVNPYSFLNLILLFCIWAAALVPKRFWETLPMQIVSYAFLAAVPMLHLLLVELLMPRTRDIVQKMLYLNIFFYYLAFLFLLFLFRRRSELAVLVGTLLSWFCGTVNCVAWEYRSLPVLPWDLYSASTALSVAQNYEFTFTHQFYTIMLTFAAIAVLGFRLKQRHHIPLPVIHWSVTGILTAALAGYLLFLQTDTVFTKFGGYRYLFTPTVYYERNGAAVSFISTLHYLNVDKPAGYDADEVADDASAYSAHVADEKAALLSSEEEMPNVIVIMNEAFSDLRALCDYETNLPVTPNIDALTENTVKGNLHVSVKGGNTANSEYEFLTGDTMAFLPAGSIPYQQHIMGETPNLASYFKSLGYETEAVHPYYASGWYRDHIYPWFSFDEDTFIEDFYPLYSYELLRGYVSDDTLFDYIIDQYEKNDKNEDAPRFTFAVTMQNHGSYDQEYANFRPDVTVNGIEEYRRISAYLSLIRKTDAYFGELIEYFRNYDEKTVIIMFGDHQPNDNVVSVLMGNAGVDNSAAALDAANRYITPYVLWANYDIDEDMIRSVMNTEDISINYLSTLLCTAAELPLTGYQTFLQSMQKAYPVITAKTVMDGINGTMHSVDALSTLQKADDGLLARYRSFAYNHIFDTKRQIADFFD
ncbi:MAG: LTA synthase family protein [Clostridia bacterium]|nr:LTA synthase family protein [Clostridia bacterium]